MTSGWVGAAACVLLPTYLHDCCIMEQNLLSVHFSLSTIVHAGILNSVLPTVAMGCFCEKRATNDKQSESNEEKDDEEQLRKGNDVSIP